MTPLPPALLVKGLRKNYGDVVAVDGLDLTVGTGESFGLLGPNGAGKTTTIEICEGLTEPDAGAQVDCASGKFAAIDRSCSGHGHSSPFAEK